VQRLVRDLNHLYRAHPALHRADCESAGFQWVRHDDGRHCTVAFVRRSGTAADAPLLVLCNFTPGVHRAHRLGVPEAGLWVERLNTDSAHYGGSNVGTPLGCARSEALPWDGMPHSIVVDVPPLAAVFFERAG
jgi:1,4-alpha-glucan branching enzyme